MRQFGFVSWLCVVTAALLLFMLAAGCAPPGQYAGPPPGYYQPQPYRAPVTRLGGTSVIDLSQTTSSGFAAGVAAAQGYPPGGRMYLMTGSGHWLKTNIDHGQMLKLEDGSLWEVASWDRITASLWLPVSAITVVEVGGYSYKLVNTDDGEAVEAKFLGVSR